MKKVILYLLSALFFVCCAEPYDDSALSGRVDDLEDRVDKLEELCRQMNTNISALQTIVKALQDSDFVTDVSAIAEGGEIIGYTITFSKSGAITIYHGEDGADGEDGRSPVIGVRQDTDGYYYWTLDGEWLLDGEGRKIRAEGRDGDTGSDGPSGQDGVTPQLKIEDGYWHVSYDSGASWTILGKASGENGDSMFSDVRQDECYVYFEMSDGTEFIIPKSAPLSITIEAVENLQAYAGAVFDLGYTVESSSDDIEIEVMASEGIYAKVVPATSKTGSIHLEIREINAGYSKVLVFVSDGRQVIMESIYFDDEERLQLKDGSLIEVSKSGGSVSLVYLSNVECELIIPGYATWIHAPQSKSLEEREFSLTVDPNSGEERSASVVVKSKSGSGKSLTYTIKQEAGHYDENLTLVLSSDKNFIEAFGDDYAKLTVTLGNTVLTDGVAFYDGNGMSLNLPDFKFTADKEGEYSIVACYGTYISDKIIIKAVPVDIPSSPSDPHPYKTEFKTRILATEFSATGCPYSPMMRSLLHDVMTDVSVADQTVHTACHSTIINNVSDPAYIRTGYEEFCNVSGFPYLCLDMYQGFSNYRTSVSEFNGMLDELLAVKENVAAGISVSSELSDNQLVVKAEVKAAETGAYRVGAFLLEDGVYGRQTGATADWMHTHDNVIRYIDSQYNSGGRDLFYGHSLGIVPKGGSSDYLFIWDLEEIYTEGSRYSEIYGGAPWEDRVEANLHLAVFVSTVMTDGKGNEFHYVNNVVDCPLNAQTPFEYR